MQNRTPVARSERPDPPEFAAVPRKYRHDGWTPERQKAFIEALVDAGCVSRGAAMVNMAQANCYTLRRAPGAEELRRARDAALDVELQRLKDFAFERAIEVSGASVMPRCSRTTCTPVVRTRWDGPALRRRTAVVAGGADMPDYVPADAVTIAHDDCGRRSRRR